MTDNNELLVQKIDLVLSDPEAFFSEESSRALSFVRAALAQRQGEPAEALTSVIQAYDAYRRRGVGPAPGEYADLVRAIESARSALAATATAEQPAEQMKPADPEVERRVVAAFEQGVRHAETLAATAPAPVAPSATEPWAALEAEIDTYLEGYELDSGEGVHTPSEAERFVMKDAIVGMFSDLDVEPLLRAVFSTPAPVAPDADNERFDATVEKVREWLVTEQAVYLSRPSVRKLVTYAQVEQPAWPAPVAPTRDDFEAVAAHFLKPPLIGASRGADFLKPMRSEDGYRIVSNYTSALESAWREWQSRIAAPAAPVAEALTDALEDLIDAVESECAGRDEEDISDELCRRLAKARAHIASTKKDEQA